MKTSYLKTHSYLRTSYLITNLIPHKTSLITNLIPHKKKLIPDNKHNKTSIKHSHNISHQTYPMPHASQTLSYFILTFSQPSPHISSLILISLDSYSSQFLVSFENTCCIEELLGLLQQELSSYILTSREWDVARNVLAVDTHCMVLLAIWLMLVNSCR